MTDSDTDDPANVTVLICGPDGLCSLCASEDRTGTDGCGSYFRAGGQAAQERGRCPACPATLHLTDGLVDAHTDPGPFTRGRCAGSGMPPTAAGELDPTAGPF